MTLSEAKALRPRDTFHEDECVLNVGPRGAVVTAVTTWRVSGQVRTWKRDTSRVAIPAKRDMYHSHTFTERDLDSIHLPSQCPLNGAL